MEPTAELLREILTYDPETGIFTWRVSTGRAVLGAVAGTRTDKGYLDIKIGRRKYKAHRLAWLYVHGEWPPHQIDHKNLDRGDNRLSNLRLATTSQNCANKLGLANTRSGTKGVDWHTQRNKWQARIKINGKLKSLGMFTDKAEAAAAYRKAAQEYFGEFARF